MAPHPPSDPRPMPPRRTSIDDIGLERMRGGGGGAEGSGSEDEEGLSPSHLSPAVVGAVSEWVADAATPTSRDAGNVWRFLLPHGGRSMRVRSKWAPVQEPVGHKLLHAGLVGDDSTAYVHMMEEWLADYAEGQGHFDSEVIFMEHKLLEGLRITEERKLPLPNRLRTAMCCHMLDRLAHRMGSLGPILAILKQEMYRSIFYAYDYNQADQYEVNDVLFAEATPYFVMVQSLTKKLISAKGDSKGSKQAIAALESTIRKQKRILDVMEVTWRRALLGESFRHWRNMVLRARRVKANTRKYINRTYESLDHLYVMVAFYQWRWRTTHLKKYRAEAKATALEVENAALVKEVEDLRARLAESEESVEGLEEHVVDLVHKLKAALEAVENAKLDSDGARQAKVWEQKFRLSEARNAELSKFCVVVTDAATDFVSTTLHDVQRLSGRAGWVSDLHEAVVGDNVDPEDMDAAEKVLQRTPTGDIILRWVDRRQAMVVGDVPRRARDFSDSFMDGDKISSLTKWMVGDADVHGNGETDTGTNVLDPATRIQLALDACRDRLRGSDFVGVKHVMAADSPDLVACFLARLFSIDDPCMYNKDLTNALLAMNDELGALKGQWGEVRGVLENIGAGQEVTDEMSAIIDDPSLREPAEAIPFGAPKDDDVAVGSRAASGAGRPAHGASSPLVKLRNAIQVMSSTLSKMSKYMHRGQSIMFDMRQRAMEFGFGEVKPRLLDRMVKDEGDEEAEEVAQFTILDRRKLRDLFKIDKLDAQGAAAEVAAAEEVLRQHSKRLSQVFKFYAAGPGGGSAVTMSSAEFWKFVKDCQIPDKKVNSASIDLIFCKEKTLNPKP